MVNILYAEMAFVCFTVVAILLNRTAYMNNKNSTKKLFAGLLAVNLVFCVDDILWGVFASGLVASEFFSYFTSYGFHFMSALSAFCWLLYTLNYFYREKNGRYPGIIAGLVLFMVQLGILTYNFVSPDVFYFDDEGIYRTGDLRQVLFILQLVNYLIMLFTALRENMKKHNSDSYDKHTVNALFFSMIPIVTGGLQYLFPEMPMYSVGFMLSSLSIFVFTLSQEQQELIINDEQLKMQVIHTEELKYHFSIINSLAGEFDLVCLVNQNKNNISVYRVGGVMKSFMDENKTVFDGPEFDAVLRAMIPTDEFDEFLKKTNRDMVTELLRTKNGYSFYFYIVYNGENLHYSMSFSLNREDPSIVVIGVKNVTDAIKAKKEKDDAIARATLDGLTGLMNKSAFMESVKKHLDESGSVRSAFIFLDMDNFKQVNDEFGHAKGDEVLREVAEKLRLCFRKDEIVARLGGDEYAVFIPSISRDILEKRINKVCAEMRMEYSNEKTSINVTGSVGCAYCIADDFTYEQLHDAADKAMYSIKKDGKNSVSMQIIDNNRK